MNLSLYSYRCIACNYNLPYGFIYINEGLIRFPCDCYATSKDIKVKIGAEKSGCYYICLEHHESIKNVAILDKDKGHFFLQMLKFATFNPIEVWRNRLKELKLRYPDWKEVNHPSIDKAIKELKKCINEDRNRSNT